MNLSKSTWIAMVLCACSTPPVTPARGLDGRSGLKRIVVEAFGLE